MHNRVGRSICSFLFGATGVSTTPVAVTEEGWVKRVIVTIPNLTNSVTATVTVKDKDGTTIWTKGTIAENASTIIGAGPDAAETGSFPLQYGYTVEMVLSGDAGGTGGTVSVLMLI